MMIFKEKTIFIITHDLELNQTFANRYFSFIKTIKLNTSNEAYGIGINFPFTPHPINSLQKSNYPLLIKGNNISIIPRNLNFIQKLLVFCDKKNFSYSIKKNLLALHIIIFKTDQWTVKLKDLKHLKLVPSIVISGGSGGIIKTSADLAKKHKAKLILDYRDPWNFGYNLLETNSLIYKFKRAFTIKQELKYLKEADHIITVSESLKGFFPLQFQNKITVIENGSNFEQDEIIKEIVEKPKMFNIVYLGTIYNEQLNDEQFFDALSKLIHENKIDQQYVKLFFLGSLKNTRLAQIISKYNLEIITFITDRLTNEELLPYLLNASLFLHLKYDNRSKIITSKNADYLMFRKPILLPVSDNGDLAESIEKHNSGYVCNGWEETLIVLKNEYQKFLNKESTTFKNRDLSYLSRSNISKKLLVVIENLS